MSLLQAFLLGTLQGITEFLPISSSGHLIAAENLLGLDVSGLLGFDVIVHVGTLLAILIYFRHDIGELIRVFLKWCLGRSLSWNEQGLLRLILYLFIGMIPASVLGLLFKDMLATTFRSSLLVGLWMIVVAFFYILVERYARQTHESISSWKSAFIIGIFQAIALLPGVSRSGMTIAAGLVQGLKREQAARFSFLLGAIALFGAFLLILPDIASGDRSVTTLNALIVGFVSSFLSGLASVAFLMKFLKGHSLAVFSWYLLVLGGFLILV